MPRMVAAGRMELFAAVETRRKFLWSNVTKCVTKRPLGAAILVSKILISLE